VQDPAKQNDASGMQQVQPTSVFAFHFHRIAAAVFIGCLESSAAFPALSE
jgi:hypothetical protein